MPIYSIDTETQGLCARKFVYGTLYDGKTYAEFENENDMYEYIIQLAEKNKKQHKNTYIYAHNHAFDLISYAKDKLIELIDERNGGIPIRLEAPLIFMKKDVSVPNSKPYLYLLDSLAFFPGSLEELGKLIALRKKQMPKKLAIDTEWETFEKTYTDDYIREYCKRDAQIVYEAIIQLKQTLNDNGFCIRKMISASQVAMSCWRQYLRKRNLLQFINSDKKGTIIKSKYEHIIKKAYRGARVEAFNRQKITESVHYVDKNAMYPYCMMNMKFPNLNSETKQTILTLDTIKNHEIGIVTCEFFVPELEIGFLPVRHQGEVLYPHKKGTYIKGTWTIQEIKKAIELGYKITKITEIITYKKLFFNPFYTFMRDLYNLRIKQTSKIGNYAIKLIMNSLYGKFAQQRTTKQYTIQYRANDTGGYISGIFNDKYLIMTKNEPYIDSYSNPIISAIITADARIMMYDMFVKIGKRNLVYTDTDSLQFKNDIFLKLFDLNTSINGWKYEKKTLKTFKALGKKTYQFDNEVHASGVPKKLLKNMNNVDEVRYVKKQKMIGIRQFLNGNVPLNEVGNFVEETHHINEQIKEIPMYIVDELEKK